jgi:hypothetical protein
LPEKKVAPREKNGDFLLFLQLAFTKASLDKTFIDRDAVRREGKKNPLQFAKEMKIFLNGLPPDQVENRKLAASFLVDIIADAQAAFAADRDYETAFYTEVHKISDDLLAQREQVEVDMSYEDYALLAPTEKDQLIEKDGQIFKSTLGTKIMGISLVKLDSNQQRSDQYLESLASKLGDTDIQSQKVLQSIKNMSFKERPSL